MTEMRRGPKVWDHTENMEFFKLNNWKQNMKQSDFKMEFKWIENIIEIKCQM